MLATVAKLALVATLLVLFAPSADAQRVHPECAKSKDKVRCTCWLSKGAVIARREKGKNLMQTTSEWDMDRIIACMRANGRPNG
jgi:hypothetical protein